MTDDVEAVARAICRVQLNGGDPDQRAARWNGIQIELQDFPAWWDYRDEARHTIAALRSLGWQKVEAGFAVVKMPTTLSDYQKNYIKALNDVNRYIIGDQSKGVSVIAMAPDDFEIRSDFGGQPVGE